MKHILITGASEGIGRAVAIEFAKRAKHRFALVARKVEKLKEVQIKLQELGSEAYVFQCDVSEAKELAQTLSKVNIQLNKIDIAILNAGISENKWIVEDDYPMSFERIYKTNVFAVGFGLNILANLMKSDGGIIAVVSSLADSRGYPSSSAYSSSKSAVTKITEAARIELKPFKIKVITIRPGFVRTNMTAKNRFPMPFLMDVEKAASIIVDGILAGKVYINFPLPMVLITKIIRCIPNRIYEFFASKFKPK
ncbi:MAG: SDR family NAD(P)-dependent oxidoreductase [Candidatus Kapaibacteriales bacterium]